MFCGSFIVLFGLAPFLESTNPKDHFIFFGIGTFSTLTMSIFLVYVNFKNTPIISIDSTVVKFGAESFLLKDIKTVIFSSKFPFPYMMSQPMESTIITFKNGVVKVVFDKLYSNTYEIKSFLEKVVLKKLINESEVITQTDKDDLILETGVVYKGNPVWSVKGAWFWLPILCVLFCLTDPVNQEIGVLVFAFLLISCWFIYHSFGMHYFVSTSKHLVVRNHIFIWVRTAFRFSDIKEIVFEENDFKRNCLRITTKDFRSKLYRAETLNSKMWGKFKKELKPRRIKVRDEL